MKHYKLYALLMALIMAFLMTVPAMAANPSQNMAASELYDLGLFRGTGMKENGAPNFDLDKTPTRGQAIIMLVRLLGKEDEAKNMEWSAPFTDVSDTLKPYVQYAYSNGYANGTKPLTFTPQNPITAAQYITFVLRVLGYTTPDDFTVATACAFADEIKLTNGEYSDASSAFNRGGLAEISAFTLLTKQKDSKSILLDSLITNGVVDAQRAVTFQSRYSNEVNIRKIAIGDKLYFTSFVTTFKCTGGGESFYTMSGDIDFIQSRDGEIYTHVAGIANILCVASGQCTYDEDAKKVIARKSEEYLTYTCNIDENLDVTYSWVLSFRGKSIDYQVVSQTPIANLELIRYKKNINGADDCTLDNWINVNTALNYFGLDASVDIKDGRLNINK